MAVKFYRKGKRIPYARILVEHLTKAQDAEPDLGDLSRYVLRQRVNGHEMFDGDRVVVAASPGSLAYPKGHTFFVARIVKSAAPVGTLAVVRIRR